MKTVVLRMPISGFVLGSALGLLLLWIHLGHADTVSVFSVSEAPHAAAVRNVAVQDNVVVGEIVNTSSRPIRDVELLIRRIWQWENEFRPGPNPPGYGDYYTVTKEIPPGGTEQFTYTLPSQPLDRADGRFETAVTLAGFTAIVREQNEQKKGDEGQPVS